MACGLVAPRLTRELPTGSIPLRRHGSSRRQSVSWTWWLRCRRASTSASHTVPLRPRSPGRYTSISHSHSYIHAHSLLAVRDRETSTHARILDLSSTTEISMACVMTLSMINFELVLVRPFTTPSPPLYTCCTSLNRPQLHIYLHSSIYWDVHDLLWCRTETAEYTLILTLRSVFAVCSQLSDSFLLVVHRLG